MHQHIALRDGGWLSHVAGFLPPAEADEVLVTLRHSIAWRQEGRPGRRFPRLTAWYADPGLEYRYSGVTHRAEPWPPAVWAVKTRAEAVAGTAWNSVLLNLYRDGRDSIGYHADDEPELGSDPVIGSVSLGAERKFVLKHPASGDRLEMVLTHGSLLVMGGSTQHHWRHGLPKSTRPVGPRINLTFRQIQSPAAGG